MLASPCFRDSDEYQILIQEGFSSAAKAYNDAIDKSENDLIVFVHQDIFLPESWIRDLKRSLNLLNIYDPEWGVIGAYGETVDDNGRGYVYSTGLGILGKRFMRPTPVQTLDEIVLIFRKSSGLRFDDRLPHFHMYGADICLTAEKKGKKNYAVCAFCIHNTRTSFFLPKEFYESYRFVKRKWKNDLPIRTTCVRISRFDRDVYARRFGELYFRYIGRNDLESSRTEDVGKLITDVNTILEKRSATS